MNTQLAQRAQSLVDQWRGDFVGVMLALGDFSPEMVVHLAPPTRQGDMLWWNQTLDLAPGAAIYIGTAEATWSALGERILKAAGVESSGPAELKDTYLEVLRQSLGVFARTIGSQLGREVTITQGREREPAPDLPFGCDIAIRADDQDLPSVAFYISQELLDALEDCAQTVAGSRRLSPPAPDDKQTDQENGGEFSARACGTLDLLLDVEMPVSVSFGRTQVRIQDILKLITGSIIELDRSIADPVEVIVNNCIVARGEVVVVDGNYGVRIHEVMSRQERLQESRKYLLPASHSHR